MQRLRIAALVLGATALLLGLGSARVVAVIADNRDAVLDTSLSHGVETVDDFFDRASSVVLLAGQNPAFADAYQLVTPRTARNRNDLSAGQQARIEEALAKVERLFRGQVGEACLIDAYGAELACVVNGDPTSAPYLGTRRPELLRAVLDGAPVHQGAPMVSADTGERVIPLSTAVRDTAGRARAVLEFRVSLDPLAGELAVASAGPRLAIVDATDGRTVLPIAPAGSAGPPGPTDEAHDVRAWQVQGRVARAGTVQAYERLSQHTATRDVESGWFVTATTVALPAGWRSPADSGPVTLTLLALACLALAAIGFVQHGRALARRALIDELTGLANRQALYDRVARATAGRCSAAAIMIIDLDRFKTVNDTLGHFAGDHLLAEVGRRFAALCPPGDLVARLGGDEFGYVMAAAADRAQILDRARQLVYALEDPILIDGAPVQVGCSVGVAVVGEHGDDVATLFRRADLAMYEAKRRHTGVTVFEPGLERRNSAGLTFETSLLLALERGELVLHYQPKIHIGTGEVCGVEALVRWQHPEQGLLGPDHFIPLAEETGLIVGLTKHVLAAALDQALAWSLAGTDIPVAVNLAARNVADPRLPTDVARLLRERDLPARMLCLELTETDLLGDPDQARTVLQELRALGVDLAVDDFGTGFASLSQLRKLPFKDLKIDKSFVAVLEGDPEAVHIVDSVVDLAHGLGLTVIAEGVETAGCLDVLRSVGCDVAQGYYFSRPLPADDLLAWVLRHDPLTVARKQPSPLSRFPATPQVAPSAL